jgi:MFS family permease
VAFSGYAQLWADRRVRALLIAAFFARIPAMTAPLVLTLFVVRELDASYTQAGIVAAASTVGAGVGAPWRGRLIDRLGMRRAIIPSIVAVALLYPLAAITTSALVLAPIAFGMGLFLIPIFSIVRLSLSVDRHQPRGRATRRGVVSPVVGGWTGRRERGVLCSRRPAPAIAPGPGRATVTDSGTAVRRPPTR